MACAMVDIHLTQGDVLECVAVSSQVCEEIIWSMLYSLEPDNHLRKPLIVRKKQASFCVSNTLIH